MKNYELLVDRIAKSAGLERSEIESKVEAKKAKLSGLISKEGAAQIIAAELGINFEDEDLKVAELIGGLRRVNIVGKVMNIFPVREFEKNDRKGKVANFILADDTGSTRVVLWDTNHIELIENEMIKVGDVVEIKNGSTRDSEIHLSSFGEIKKSSVVMDEVKNAPAASEITLEEARQGMSVKTRGVVVQVFQPRFYSVCPTCNKKGLIGDDGVFKCAEHGVVEKKDRAILNFVLDDGTDSMRVVMFSDQINLVVPEEDLKSEEKAAAFRDDFLGTEIYLSGRVNRNQLFNNLEIVANGVERVDVEKLVEELSNSNS
jgi:ssDNA-binding replication factor A large subunit